MICGETSGTHTLFFNKCVRPLFSLMLSRAGRELHVTVKSADRNDFLRKPKLH
jgi:hypothetical protein